MLLKIEKQYTKSLENEYLALSKAYESIKAKGELSLEGREITEAILLRLKVYYQTQNKIKELLNKRYISGGSDFFVEVIIFYLKLLLDIKGINVSVDSEKQIKQNRRAMRPDISIWKDNEVLAIVECKTQFSWNRHNWESEFKKREVRLKRDFPKATAFLLVMTSVGWGGFPKNSTLIGKQYFTLFSKWPTEIGENAVDEVVINPIEELFEGILKAVKR